MKKTLALLAGAAALAALAAAPAAADSRVSFGVSINSGYGAYGAPYRYGSRYDPYRYPRAARSYRSPCGYYDAYCGYPAPYRSARRIAPPAYVLAMPRATGWERTERYDPMPRWRALAGRPDGRDAAALPPPPQSRLPQDAAPPARGDLVRYDLAGQGYDAAQLQAAPAAGYSGYDDPAYEYGYDDGAVRYDRYGGNGAVPSGIERRPGDPEDLLLGGPQ